MHQISSRSDEIIRRAVRTARVAWPASGYPRPPQRTVQYVCGGRPETGALARGAAHPGRRFRRFV